MSAYVIVDITITDPVAYEGYKRAAAPTVVAHGGRYIVRGGACSVLEGSSTPGRVVVLEFPSVEAARAWWDSPEYAPIKAIRHRSAETSMLLVEGLAVPIG